MPINRDQQPALGVNHTCMPSVYLVGVQVRPGSRPLPPSAGVGAGTLGGVARLSTPSGCPGAAAMATRVGAPRAAAARTGQGGSWRRGSSRRNDEGGVGLGLEVTIGERQYDACAVHSK